MWSFKDSDNIANSVNKQVRRWKIIVRYTKTQKRKRKAVICERTFMGPLRLDVQSFRPWCKRKYD